MISSVSKKIKMGFIGLLCISTVGCQNMTGEDWGVLALGAIVIGAVAAVAVSDSDDDDDKHHHRRNDDRHDKGRHDKGRHDKDRRKRR